MGKPRLTRDEFIRRGKKHYGNRYDYSKVVYERKDGKVTLVCPIHGDFQLKAENHMNGKAGCRFCRDTETGLKNRSNTSEFVEKSKKLHGDKYNYSKSVYETNYLKVIIICAIHGEFRISPNEHLSGGGCAKCSGRAKLNNEEFIKRAIDIHSNRYDYTEVEYANFDTKVRIVCRKHGRFECTPRNHLQLKNGCPKCSISKSEWFICKWFERNNIKYIFQKSFPTCRLKKRLRFDFWLPDKGILLEFDGKQHFETDSKKYSYVKLRDEIKENWCKENNVPLIRIGYLEKLEQKLKEYFL